MACPCCDQPHGNCVQYANCGNVPFRPYAWIYTCQPNPIYDPVKYAGKCSSLKLATASPYNCLNNAFQGGAWITVSNWLLDGTGPSAAINSTWFVMPDCLGTCYLEAEIGDDIIVLAWKLCLNRVEASVLHYTDASRTSYVYDLRIGVGPVAPSLEMPKCAYTTPENDPGDEYPFSGCNCVPFSGVFNQKSGNTASFSVVEA